MFIKKTSFNYITLDQLDYFKNKKDGFYVDVGCYHPIHRNNTYLLHKKNWNGINIDTSKFSIDLFSDVSSDILIIIMQVSNKNEVIKLVLPERT